ncbi:MAG TPA: hypothetical protein VG457_06665, partial [Planctomycetota bacterium]|nr:hypothetical protein [Planctomycetota bacterium]
TGISNAAYFTETPSLALDSAGNPVVAWTHCDNPGQGIFTFVKHWNGTAWVDYGGSGTATGVSGPGGSGQAPSIDLDSAGNPMVAWHEYGLSAAPYGEIYLRRWDGTAWAELGGSATGGGISAAGNGARYPSLKIGPSNQPVVAWGNGPEFSTDEIFVKTWNGTAWVEIAGSATGGGVSNTPTVSSTYPSLALSAAGDPAVAWSEDLNGSAHRVYFRQVLAAPPPTLRVTAMTPAPGSVLKKNDFSVLTVTLSAPPDPTTVNSVSVELVRAGKDKKLGTADDVPIHTTVSLSGDVIQIQVCRKELPSGAYRLRVKGTAGIGPGSAVRSVSGHLLDGEFTGSFPSGDGTDGGDFVADFTLK